MVSAIAGVGCGLAVGALSPGASQDTPLIVFACGCVAICAMILPGISGSYILLIFGLYDVVVGSLRPRDLLEDVGGSLGILVPIALGVALGIGGLSNVLKVLLARFERPAHAALLGLLLGLVHGEPELALLAIQLLEREHGQDQVRGWLNRLEAAARTELPGRWAAKGHHLRAWLRAYGLDRPVQPLQHAARTAQRYSFLQ